MIGTATSRTAPHQKCSTSQPPKMGPSAAPPEKPAAQMATASRRRLGSGKMLRIRDRVDGISMAPKKPSAARPAMSHSALGAKAVAAETAAKPDSCRSAAAGGARSGRPGCPWQPAARQGPGDRRPRSTATGRRRGPGCGRSPGAQTSGRCCPRPPAAPGTSAGPGQASRATPPWWEPACRLRCRGAGVLAGGCGHGHGNNYTVWTV